MTLTLWMYSMYILLRGQVTIYIWDSKTDTSDDDQLDGLVPLAGSTGNIRQQLGSVVTSLGQSLPSSLFHSFSLPHHSVYSLPHCPYLIPVFDAR
jgi:hypothetical protein